MIIIGYESFFGNTKTIAQAVARGISSQNVEIELCLCSEISTEMLEKADTLVLGTPTRAFQPSPATKAFLSRLPLLTGLKIAVFDTRVDVQEIDSRFLSFMVKLFGYAAGSMHKALLRKGAVPLTEPHFFYVKDSEGPLAAGEEERAHRWGEKLARLGAVN